MAFGLIRPGIINDCPVDPITAKNRTAYREKI